MRGFRRFKKELSGSEQDVDLGLSNLVGEVSLDGEALREVELVAEAGIAEIATQSGGVPDEFEVLESSSQWSKLSQLAEKRLETSLEGSPLLKLSARYWWLLAQLRLAEIPLSILFAPLDAALREVPVPEEASDAHGLTKLALLRERVVQLFKENCFSRSEQGLWEKLSQSVATEEAPGTVAVKKEPHGFDSVDLSSEKASIGELSSSAAPIQNPSTAAQNRNLRRMLEVVFVAALAIFGYLCLDPAGRPVPLVQYEENRSEVNLLEPQNSRIADVSRLEAMFYDLTLNDRASAVQAGTQNQINSPVPPAGSEGMGGANLEAINTSSPLEPADVRQAIESNSNDPGQSTGANQRSLAHVASSRIASGPRFEDYRRPRTFEVIAETRIMSDASTKSEVLGQLRAGDRILVEGREGYWLRIRARQNNRLAYVLAQDAAPEAEF